MHKLKPGDKVRVIADEAGHGYPKGSVFKVKQVIDRKDPVNPYTEVRMVDCGTFFFETDVQKIIPYNKKPGNFLITDPRYIMDLKQYQEIYDNHARYEEPDFEEQTFPINSKHHETGEKIIIHLIEKTPYKGGGECYIEEEFVLNDSGLLCIAENKNGWLNEMYGTRFETLQTSKDMFPIILNKF